MSKHPSMIIVKEENYLICQFTVRPRDSSQNRDRSNKSKPLAGLNIHYVKIVRIWSYSGPYFPTFGLNKERYGVSLRIKSECGKYGPELFRIQTLFTQ